MNDIKLIEDYSKSIENYIVLMNQITYDEVVNNLETIENDILSYLHDKFPNMSVSRDELHTILLKIYQTKNFNLKKDVECNLGKAKFDFEDKRRNVEKIISQEIEKLRKLFSSVKLGTNYRYLGFVDECTLEIVAHLIRCHNSISFSKETEKTKQSIRKLIETNYKLTMNNMGEQLLVRIVEPLEHKFIMNEESLLEFNKNL